MKTKPPTLRDAVAGDKVYVVKLAKRNQTVQQAYTATISRVGHKYAYIGTGRQELMKFDRTTGKSFDSDGLSRCNGYGFDVYLSDQDYLKELHDQVEAKRLAERMCHHLGGLKQFPPSVVDAIHSILDAEGLD